MSPFYYLLVTSASSLLTVSSTRVGTRLSVSRLYQQRPAHSLGDRSCLMNIMSEFQRCILFYAKLQKGATWNRSHWTPCAAGSLGHLCFLSSERAAVRWSASSHPHQGQFWAWLLLNCPWFRDPINISNHIIPACLTAKAGQRLLLLGETAEGVQGIRKWFQITEWHQRCHYY